MMSYLFKVTEFDTRTLAETGRVEHYYAPTIDEAVKSVRYMRSLEGNAVTTGPTGSVVYAGTLSYAVTSAR